MRTRLSIALVGMAGALLLPLAGVAQIVPLGAEFQVSDFTVTAQSWPAIAAAGTGFVATWTDFDRDQDGVGIFAKRYSSSGQGVGAEFQVNTYTIGYQGISAAAGAPGGTFVVAWTSLYQDGYSYGIFAQRFDSAGQQAGTEFQVNSYTVGHQGYYSQGHPSIAAAADGAFIVAWISGDQDGDADGVFARRYDSAGQTAGTEFQVNSHTQGPQYEPKVAAAADGAFVVVWSSQDQDGDGLGIRARRFDSAGQGLGGEFQVNAHTAGNQFAPVMAGAADGSFVAAWNSEGRDGDDAGLFARRFDSAGQSVGTEFQVNEYTLGTQGYQSAAVGAADGSFVLMWDDGGKDGLSDGIFGRRYSSGGAAIGGEFQVNSYTPSSQSWPTVAVLANGGFMVGWESGSGQDGYSDGVFGQVYGSPSDCGNGTLDGGEQCDDGNTVDADGCDSNCTTTACGNGIITGTEECDDGNVLDGDGCSSTCTDTAPPENESAPALTAGQTLTSDTEADGATPEDPVETSITLFAGTAAVTGTAAATIAELSGEPAPVPGYSFFGQRVQINFTCSGTCATPTAPLTLTFRIDASRIPPGVTENTFAVLRDGVAIGPCTGSPGVASPDPCVAERELFGDGDIGATILTSLASEWTFAESTCSATPIACANPGKAIFSVKKSGDPSGTKLIWKWLKGSIADASAFGDPTAGTSYTVCVYDGGALVESHSVAGGGTCDGGPCWKTVGSKGFKYKNPAGNDSGVNKVLLKSGAGKSKILVKAKGSTLIVPSSDPIYAQSPDVTVQFVSSGGGCWQAVYPAAATNSTGEQFKDKMP